MIVSSNAVFLVFISSVVICCGTMTDRTVIVNLRGQGEVKGNFSTTKWTNQAFMKFLSIPFAESPSGELRFKAPVPRRPWQGTLDATNYGRGCPQSDNIATASATEDLEDCLTLSVYTKKLDARQPVMMYIHGGGYYLGSGSGYPPGYLLEKDVVLVVPQSRLGALGFAALRTAGMPGNAGILDLILSLQWIKHHISNFGGDPNNIIVMGESTGSVLANALHLSPKTPPGLIKRVIAQSASILDNWTMDKDPKAQVERIYKKLTGKDCKNPREMERRLREATVKEIVEAQHSGWHSHFGPIIEDFYGVLPQHPSVMIENYKGSVPLLMGFTKHDGGFVLAEHYNNMKKEQPNLNSVSVREFATKLMDYVNDTSGLTNNLLTRLLFSPELLDSNDHKKALPAYFDLVNDQFMKSQIIAFVKKLLRFKYSAPIYLYTFDYAGANTFFELGDSNAPYPFNGGVHHANDLIYLFPYFFPLNNDDMEMAKKTVELWTSFAINGVPNAGGVEPKIPAMKTESGPYFHINKQITIGEDVLQELTAVIDDPNNDELNRKNIEF